MSPTQPRPSSRAFLAFLLVLVLPGRQVWAGATANQRTKKNNVIVFDEVVPGTDGFAVIDNVCLRFTSALTAGDFLFAMERVNAPSGPVFRKESRVVEDFPQEVEFEIEATVYPCHAGDVVPPVLVLAPVEAPEFMRSPHFEAQWMKGSQPRPAQIISMRASPLLFRETGPATWYYTVRVRSENTPLTDEFVVLFLAAPELPLVRLRASLVSSPGMGSAWVLPVEIRSLSGKVVGRTQRPVPDALVELFDAASKRRVESARSDENGRFLFSKRKRGVYVLKATKQGYTPSFCHVVIEKQALAPLVLQLDIGR